MMILQAIMAEYAFFCSSFIVGHHAFEWLKPFAVKGFRKIF